MVLDVVVIADPCGDCASKVAAFEEVTEGVIVSVKKCVRVHVGDA